MAEFTDADVGLGPPSVTGAFAQPRELSDAEVFGAPVSAPVSGQFTGPEPPPGSLPAVDPGLGQRFLLNAREGFQSTLAGEVYNRVRSGQVAQTATDAATRALREATVAGSQTALDNFSDGQPSPYAQMPLDMLRQEIARGQQMADERRPVYAAERGAEQAEFEALPSFRQAGSVGEQFLQGATSLLGQLAGGLPSPENLVAGPGGRGLGVARNIAQGVGEGAVAGAIADPVVQAGRVSRGEQQGFEGGQLAESVLIGGGAGGTLRLGGLAWRGLRDVMARRRGVDPATITPDTVAPDEARADLESPEFQAFAQANGLQPGDPRAAVLQERVAARRAAEAQRPAPGELPTESRGAVDAENARRQAEIAGVADGTIDPAATNLKPRDQIAAPIRVDSEGGAFVADDGALQGQQKAPILERAARPALPAPGRHVMTAEEATRARADAEGGQPNMAEPPDRLIAPDGRQPQTRGQVGEQREAGEAFDLAQRQSERVRPNVRDTQAGGRPQGRGAQQVVIDGDRPVLVVGEGTAEGRPVAIVRPYDPRTGEPEPGATDYLTDPARLRSVEYAPEPRMAQDFEDRARVKGNIDLKQGLPRQTYRASPPELQRPVDVPPPARLVDHPQATDPVRADSPQASPEQPISPRRENVPAGEYRAPETREVPAPDPTSAVRPYSEVIAEQQDAARRERGGNFKSVRTLGQEAPLRAYEAEGRPEVDALARENDLPPFDHDQIARYYVRAEGETPRQAADRALERHFDDDERQAMAEEGWTTEDRAALAEWAERGDPVFDSQISTDRYGEDSFFTRNLPGYGQPGFGGSPRSQAARDLGRYQRPAPEDDIPFDMEGPDGGRPASRGETALDAGREGGGEGRPPEGGEPAGGGEVRPAWEPERNAAGRLVRDDQGRQWEQAVIPGAERRATTDEAALGKFAKTVQPRAFVENARNASLLSGFIDERGRLWEFHPEHMMHDDFFAANPGASDRLVRVSSFFEKGKGDIGINQPQNVTPEQSATVAAIASNYRRAGLGEVNITKGKLDQPPPPEGGLFDTDARNQRNLFDILGDESGALNVGQALNTAGKAIGLTDTYKRDVGQFWNDLKATRSAIDSGKKTPLWRHGGVMGSIGRGLFYSNDAEMRALATHYKSPTIKAIADMLHAPADVGRGGAVSRTFHEAVDARTNSNLNKLSATMDRFVGKRAELEQIRRLVQNPQNIRPGTPIHDAAKAIRQLLDDEWQYLKDAGVDVGNVKGYFPRVVDPTLVMADPVGFTRAAARQYLDDGLATNMTDAMEKANAWLASIELGNAGAKKDGTDFVILGGTPNADFRKERVFSDSIERDPNNPLRRFYVQDPIDTLTLHFQRTARRAEWARRFGDDLSKWKQLKEDIISEDNGRALRDVVDLIGNATGVTRAYLPNSARVGAAFLRTWGAMMLLPHATVTSLSEIAMPAIRGGAPQRLLGDIARTAKALAGKMDEDKGIAEDLGIITSAIGDSILGRRYYALDTGSKVQQRIINGFFRRTGLEQLTRAQRTVAVAGSRVFLRRLSLDVVNDTARANSSRAYLRELGVDNPDAFARWVAAAPDAKPARADLQQAGAMEEAYQTAVMRFVNQAVMNPTSSTRPRWANHPLGSMVFMLQSYAYAFTKNVLGRAGSAVAEATTKGGYGAADRATLLAPAMMLPLLAAIQWGLDEPRQEILGGERKEEDVGSKFIRIIGRAGLTGTLDPWLNIAKGARYDRDAATALAGPVFGSIANTVDTGLKTAVRNSPNTNTAERNLTQAFYRMVVSPAVATLASLSPAGLGAAAIYSASSGKAREAFTTEVAGPKKPTGRKGPPQPPRPKRPRPGG